MEGHTTGLQNRSMIKTEQAAVHGKKNLDVAVYRECISQGSLGRELIEGSFYECDSQAVVQLVQQRLSTNGKPRKSVSCSVFTVGYLSWSLV